MLIKKKYLIFCLLILFISIASVSASEINQTDAAHVSDYDILSADEISTAGDEIVGLNDNSEEILGDTVANFTELKGIIDGNGSGSTIILGKDYTRASTNNNEKITINKELTIDGQGHTLNGNGSTIFTVSTSSRIVLKNLTFTGAKNSAVIFSNSARCEIINCTFVDNYILNNNGAAIRFGYVSYSNFTNVKFLRNTLNITSTTSYGGGAIYASSVTDCVFDNVNFTDNRITSTWGNADYNRYFHSGGAFYAGNLQYTKIINSNFNNNSDWGGYGGVIYTTYCNNNIFRYLNITNNTAGDGAFLYFRYDSANDIFDHLICEGNNGGYGGVFYSYYQLSNMTFTNSTFKNNTADRYGGIFSQNYALNTEFTSYHNFNLTFEDVEFIGNGVKGDLGGVFHWTFGTNGFVYNRVNFTNNYAPRGGCFYIQKNNKGSVLATNMTFRNVNFVNNYATTGNSVQGGVFYTSTSTSHYDFIDCTFEGNSANGGGSFYLTETASYYTFENTNFTSNHANNGGVFHFFQNANNFLFNNTYFENNSAGAGGVIYKQGHSRSSSLTNFKFVDTDFINNTATSVGGVMYTGHGENNNYQTVTVRNVDFEEVNFINNSAQSGGGLWFGGTTTHIEFNNVTFEGNLANSSYGGSANGAAVNFYRPTSGSEFNNVDFVNNTAYGSGGAVYFGKYSQNSQSTDTVFNNVNFINNTAVTGTGGAVYLIGKNSTFNQTTFENNSAPSGGAVAITVWYNDYNLPTINNTFIDCNFTNNRASDSGKGSAISSDNNDLRIADSTFTSNNGGQSVIYSNLPTDIQDSQFYDNSANSEIIHQEQRNYPAGDAISTITISNTVFENNTGNQVSVVGTSSVPVHVDNCNFTNNSGSGLSIDSSNNATVSNSNFKNSNISGDGAAINLHNSNASISTSTFEDNHANEGGAIYFSNSNCDISDSIFSDNSATSGGAISGTNSQNVNIDGSTFTNNSASYGSAISFNGVESGNVSNSYFSDNHVSQLQLIVTPNSYTMSIIANLTGGNTQINAIYSDRDMVSYSNVRYLTDAGILNTDENKSVYVRGIPYQNVTILVYDSEGNLVVNMTNMTNEVGIAIFYNLNLEPGNYTIEAYHFENTQYAYGEGEGEFKELGNFTILQLLVDMTEDGGVLDLTQDFTYTIGLDDDIVDGVRIDKNITINGNGHFIDALYKSRIFDVEGYTIWDEDTGTVIFSPIKVHLTNMTLVKGNSTFGGAIYAYEVNNLTIDYCDFIDNNITGVMVWVPREGESRGSASAAAIALDYVVNSTISDCRFINNTVCNPYAIGMNGAMYLYGFNNTITRCEFINNSVDSYGNSWLFWGFDSAGALGIDGFNNTVENSIFENNSVLYDDALGGAIYGEYCEESTFRNLTFKNNTAAMGGAMYLSWVINTIVEDCTFEYNYVDVSEDYSAMGGAIYATSFSLIVKNSTFESNNASMGAAIYIERPWSDNFVVNNVIENSRFFNNNATVTGGGIYISGLENLTVKGSKFVNNTAGEGAGALAIVGSSYISIEESEFINNSGYIGESIGGAIAVIESGEFAFTDNLFESNFAFMGGAIVFQNSGEINVTNNKFRYNSAVNGSAIYLLESGDIFFSKSTFLDNKANASELFSEFDNSYAYATMTGYDNYINAIYSDTDEIYFDDVDYWAYPATVNSNNVAVFNSNYEFGQTIIFEFYDSENNLVKNDSARTNLSAIAKMPYYDLKPGVYTVRIYHPDDNYYTYVECETKTVEVMENNMGDFEILQKLIDDLDDGQTLKLSRDFTYTLNLDDITNGIEINKRNITIDGNGKTIDALAKSRIFNITDSDVLIKNVTFANATSIDPETNGGAVYVASSDVIIEDVEFVNNTANDGTAVYVESGMLNMVDSILNDKNSIYNGGEAILINLIQNAQNSDYAVYNEGTLSLKNNKFNNLIKNYGKIITETHIIILDNATITIYEDSYRLIANVTDDNGNIIELRKFSFMDDVDLGDADFNGTHYSFEYSDVSYGVHIINASAAGLDNVTIDTATLIVIQVTDFELKINQINNGEKVVITAIITPAVEGNVTIMVNNIIYPSKIDRDGMATLTLENLSAGKYNVLATYPGEEYILNSSDNSSFTVIFLPSTIEICVENQDKVIIKANVTDGATGYVTFIVDGIPYTKAVGEDLEIDAFAPGNHSIVAIYGGDDVYKSSSNNTVYKIDKLESLVKVSAKNVGYGNDAVILVEVPKNQTGLVSITIGDNNYTEELKNGKAIFNISGLAANTYSVSVVYEGDANYDSNTNVSSFKVTKAVLDAGVSALDVTVSQNASFIISVPDDFVGKVRITVDDVTYDGEVSDVIEVAGLTAGSKEATVKFYDDPNYNDMTLSVSFDVTEDEIPVVKNASDVKVSVVGGKIVATVADGVEGNITFVVNGKEYIKDIADGRAVLEDALLVGDNYISAFCPESDVFNASMDSMVYNMAKLDSLVKVSAKNIVYGSDAVITVEVPKAQTGFVTITVNDKSYIKQLVSGNAQFKVSDLAVGSYPITVSYNGDDIYDVNSNTSSFNVTKAALDAGVSALNVTVSQNASFIISVPDDFAGKVRITVDDITYDGDVSYVIEMANLTAGDKNAEVSFYGDKNYNDKTLTVQFGVVPETVPADKKDVNLTIDVKDDEISVNVPGDATGDVTIYVNDEKYTVPVKDGKAVVNNITFDKGNNVITAVYSGDDNYNLGYAGKNVSITTNSSVVISAENVTKYFSGSERFIVNVSYVNGTPIPGIDVIISINGVDYDRSTNTNGIASIQLNLNSGNYSVHVSVEKYNFTSTNAVEILPTIYASDVTKVFRNATQYYGLFLDGEGNPLANTQVSFNIHGVFYNRTTNASGWARLNLNLEKGKYILTAINPVTGEMRTNMVTVISQLETSDLVKYYKNDSQYVVRVRADDGSWAGAGEEVKFNINGMLYTRTTNETGHVKLNLNIEPGSYIITTYYKDCREGNNITVLPVLSANDLNMKYRDGSKFEAKVVDGVGRAYADQTVTFNINGVFYNRTTNSEGIAKLNINLQAGKYIITSEYNGARISNTIKIEA